MRKLSIQTILSFAVLLTANSTSWASPIFLDLTGTRFYDFDLFVAPSITVVAGELGFVQATLLNKGTEPATFKPYDPTNPIGGFGWNFNDPGLAIGFFGRNFFGSGGNGLPPDSHTFVIGEGKVDASAMIFQTSPANFSNLSNVTIQPGSTLTFPLWTVLTRESSFSYQTAIQLAFGDPIFAGFNSDRFLVDVSVGSESGMGPFMQIGLHNFSFKQVPVPEPSTLLLFCLGAAALAIAKWCPTKERNLPFAAATPGPQCSQNGCSRFASTRHPHAVAFRS